jgi:hypothetical protein
MINVKASGARTPDLHPRTLKMMPKSETIVMAASVIVTVATHNLAIGIGVGVGVLPRSAPDSGDLRGATTRRGMSSSSLW